ncbi:hypothetical protein BC628DRAFT_1423461 [Trametes gibbosa]|nr:hypothetical protein BC628DRAFT_1423461 [Trametes gibbosa]
MSSAIVLPSLPNWVQQRVSALYGAKSVDAFNSAFDLFVSEHATIRVNGNEMTRAEYKSLLQGQTSADTSAGISGTVTFGDVVSVPADGDASAIGTGSVGASFKAVVFGRVFVFAHRESSTISSSLNVVVKDDVPRPHQIGHGGAFDGRRATVIDEVFTEALNSALPVTSNPSS